MLAPSPLQNRKLAPLAQHKFDLHADELRVTYVVPKSSNSAIAAGLNLENQPVPRLRPASEVPSQLRNRNFGTLPSQRLNSSCSLATSYLRSSLLARYMAPMLCRSIQCRLGTTLLIYRRGVGESLRRPLPQRLQGLLRPMLRFEATERW